MTAPKFRLEAAPALILNAPDCGACDVEVVSDGDDWTCPNCWSSWSYDQGDGDAGRLYAEWSGDDVEGLPVVSPVDAWKFAPGYERLAAAVVDAGQTFPRDPRRPGSPTSAFLSSRFTVPGVM